MLDQRHGSMDVALTFRLPTSKAHKYIQCLIPFGVDAEMMMMPILG